MYSAGQVTKQIAEEFNISASTVRLRAVNLQKIYPNDFYYKGSMLRITEKGKERLLQNLKDKPLRTYSKKQRVRSKNLTACLMCNSKLNKVEFNVTYCPFCEQFYYRNRKAYYTITGFLVSETGKILKKDKS